MKVYVDENETPLFAEHVNRIFVGSGVELRTPADEGLATLNDVPLFEELAERRFSGLITRDRMQLRRVDPDTGISEADKLHACGLHWIGHTTPAAEGALLVAQITALYLLHWPALVEALDTLTVPSAIPIRRESNPMIRAYPLLK